MKKAEKLKEEYKKKVRKECEDYEKRFKDLKNECYLDFFNNKVHVGTGNLIYVAFANYPLVLFHETGHEVFYNLATRGEYSGEVTVDWLRGGLFKPDYPTFKEFLIKKYSKDTGLRVYHAFSHPWGSYWKEKEVSYEEYKELLEKSREEVLLFNNQMTQNELICSFGGPVFDIISGVCLLALTALMRKKYNKLSNLISGVAILHEFNAISYALSNWEKSDYVKIAEMLDIPHALVASLFTSIFLAILGSNVYLGLKPTSTLTKKEKRVIKGWKVKKEDNLMKPRDLLNNWVKNYEESIELYTLSYFLNSDISTLPKYHIKSFNKQEYFNKRFNEDEVKYFLYSQVFNLNLGESIEKDELFEIFSVKGLKSSPLKESLQGLKEIASDFVDVFEAIPYLGDNDFFIEKVNDMRIATCNSFMEEEYGLKFNKKQKRKNQLLLEILALRELVKAKPDNNSLIKKYKNLVKADAEIYMLFSSLLEVYYEDYFHFWGQTKRKDMLKNFFNKYDNIRKCNKMIKEVNSIITEIPRRMEIFFEKNPQVLKKLEENARRLGYFDVDFESIKISKVPLLTHFDFMNIISLLQDDEFMDEEGNPKYCDILAQRLVTKGNPYYTHREGLGEGFEKKYERMKDAWKEMMGLNEKFVKNLMQLTSKYAGKSSKLPGGKELSQEYKEVVEDALSSLK